MLEKLTRRRVKFLILILFACDALLIVKAACQPARMLGKEGQLYISLQQAEKGGGVDYPRVREVINAYKKMWDEFFVASVFLCVLKFAAILVIASFPRPESDGAAGSLR